MVRGGHYDIAVLDLNTATEETITSTFGNALSPDWDPSGRFIVYERPFLSYGAPDSSSGLFIVDTMTRADRALRHDGVPTYGGNPRWSPDSMTIAFSYGTPLHIYRVNVDGTGYVNLTPGDQRWNDRPSWTPDGQRIIFESFDPSRQHHETRVVGKDGGTWQRWSPDVSPLGYRSAISRDGVFFVFTGPDSGGNYGVLYRQGLSDVVGSSRRQLTAYVSPDPSASSGEWRLDP